VQDHLDESHQSMSYKAEIIYVGGFRFPDRDVAAARVRGIGVALRDAGYSVAFAGTEDSASPEDLQADGLACRDGLYYYPAKKIDSAKFARIRRGIYHYVTGSAVMDRLRYLVSDSTRAIIVYNGTSLQLWRLMHFCRKRNIKLIADCTEWHDPGDVMFGPLGPNRWDTELRMRWLQPKIGSLIVISSYLERYYRERGCSVLRVPPLVDLQKPWWKPIPPLPREDSELHLLYAGAPTRKDLVPNALRAVIQLRAEKYPIKVHLVGASRESLGFWLRQDPGFVDALGDAVVYHGRVSRIQAIELISMADFTMLLRKNKRYAHAGFPTKLVESLSAGVPIITNVTSDIGEYVRDGREGILLDDFSPEAFAAGVRRIFQMPRSKWHEMRSDSRKRAEECFDYRGYVSKLKEFMEQECGQNAARKLSIPQSSTVFRPSAKTLQDIIKASPLHKRIRYQMRGCMAWALSLTAKVPLDRNWIFCPGYHYVLDDERRNFDRQLKYMSRLGEFISLDDAMDALQNPKGVNGRYFCLTFDDGFKNSFSNALPILLDNRAPAAFFIPTDYIGLEMERDRNKLNGFFSRSQSYTLPIEFLNWDECRHLVDAGMTIGSHTCSHVALKGLSESVLKHELLDSKHCIEERLGTECRHFCCPWGYPNLDFDPQIHPQLVHNYGYQSFVSTEYGYNTSIKENSYLRRRCLLAIDSTALFRYALGQCNRFQSSVRKD
jgi:glycosyltransferase involved in cell wall biosynthesis/peptidoglycan/xylan/chitin deacetylase (PgdA/CDA1 family)